VAQILLIFIRIFSYTDESWDWKNQLNYCIKEIWSTSPYNSCQREFISSCRGFIDSNSNALITDLQLLNANLLLTTCEGVGGGVAVWSLINAYMAPSALVCFTASTDAENDFWTRVPISGWADFKLAEQEIHMNGPLMREGPTDSTTATTIVPVING